MEGKNLDTVNHFEDRVTPTAPLTLRAGLVW